MLCRRVWMVVLGGVIGWATSGFGQTEPGSAVPTLKAKAQLVVVDVVVTDSKHESVHNLKASDFTVMENSSRQQVTSFEEHVTIAPDKAAKIAPMKPLPPGIFTNFTPVALGSAVNVLLFDALNTRMKDQSYVLDQMRKYLQNAPAGAQIAIFGLNSRLILLQGFTSDPEILKATVEKMHLGSSVGLTTSGAEDPVGNGGTITLGGMMAGMEGGDIGQLKKNMSVGELIRAQDDLQVRVNTTLGAMNQLAHYLAGVPGRKNLIWFSAEYPIDSEFKTEGKYRETINLLARSRVAVYPVGPAGVRSNTPPDCYSCPVLVGKALVDYQNKLSAQQAASDMAMQQLAADTGGQAYANDNELSDVMGKAMENGANYYTLSYTPTDSRQNGEFHKIQVKLAQQGLTLNYRNGYYADAPEAKSKLKVETATGPAQPNAQPTAMTSVMMRGTPVATEIMLKLQVRPASDAKEDAVAPRNVMVANPVTKVMMSGPFRRYGIDVAADAGDIQVTPTADGRYGFSVEMITYVYNANGVLVNTAVERAKGNLLAATFANMRRTGVPFRQEISVPADGGEYYLRTAVHDLNTDRYGVVEIPVAAVAKLPVLNTAANAPAGAK